MPKFGGVVKNFFLFWCVVRLAKGGAGWLGLGEVWEEVIVSSRNSGVFGADCGEAYVEFGRCAGADFLLCALCVRSAISASK
jgi:hypothetical protein